MSDQALLEQIATLTTGRYYYMPTVDDLFEIYNYIRGQVTGDSIIVNESAVASHSRVGAFVDRLATEVTFCVAWNEPNLHFAADEARQQDEICIRLRDPRGRLLHPNAGFVRRTVGAGYVLFEIQEPLPGRWYIEASTVRSTHTRYTVGGFVRSPLRLMIELPFQRLIAGMPLTIGAQVLDSKQAVMNFRATTQVRAMAVGIPNMLKQYASSLRRIKPDETLIADGVPQDIARLSVLRDKLLDSRGRDIFHHVQDSTALKHLTREELIRMGFIGQDPVIPNDPVGGNGPVIPVIPGGGNGPMIPVIPGGGFGPVVTIEPLALSGFSFRSLLTGIYGTQYFNTRQRGSYNIVVRAEGTAPRSNTRFVRTGMVSVLVR
jgi:hypothetical protein